MSDDALSRCCKELSDMGERLHAALEREKVLEEALMWMKNATCGKDDCLCCEIDLKKSTEVLARVKAIRDGK